MLTGLGLELDALSHAHNAAEAELWDHAYRRFGLSGLLAAGGLISGVVPPGNAVKHLG